MLLLLLLLLHRTPLLLLMLLRRALRVSPLLARRCAQWFGCLNRSCTQPPIRTSAQQNQWHKPEAAKLHMSSDDAAGTEEVAEGAVAGAETVAPPNIAFKSRRSSTTFTFSFVCFRLRDERRVTSRYIDVYTMNRIANQRISIRIEIVVNCQYRV